jgi:DNA-binding NtrC family response regulator
LKTSLNKFDESPADLDKAPTILIVDDEVSSRLRLEMICLEIRSNQLINIILAESIQDALKILKHKSVNVMLLDKNLGADESKQDHNGIESIPRFLVLQPQLQIIVVTGSKDTQDVARAVSLGAFWYLPKDTDETIMALQIRKALQVSDLAIGNFQTLTSLHSTGDVALAGRSPSMKRLKAQLIAVAETNRPILLLGESGSGKTTAAKFIHQYRKDALKQPNRPIFSVNMGAITPSLAERELFGNEAGAFTGASSIQPGIFELANNGTLFLDEIGEAPLELQVKLLKVLEDGEFVRLGGKTVQKTAFKLVCATNRNLESMVSRGEFREDLYMRISTFVVNLPSLADRLEDIPEIIQVLLPKCCQENNVRIEFSDLPHDFVEYLTKHPQRGNIRGLEHQLSRLLVYSPKDKRGRPILNGWRDIPGLLFKKTAPPLSRTPITLKELESRPFELLSPDFPGFYPFISKISERLLEEAMKKHLKMSDAASILKISPAKMCMERKRMTSRASGTISRKRRTARSEVTPQ